MCLGDHLSVKPCVSKDRCEPCGTCAKARSRSWLSVGPGLSCARRPSGHGAPGQIPLVKQDTHTRQTWPVSLRFVPDVASYRFVSAKSWRVTFASLPNVARFASPRCHTWPSRFARATPRYQPWPYRSQTLPFAPFATNAGHTHFAGQPPAGPR